MTDPLRTRIAATQRDHYPVECAGYLQCGCGKRFVPWRGAKAAWGEHVADAVLAELRETWGTPSFDNGRTDDYQYVCHPCGSSFSFYSSSTMQQFALMHSGSHNPKDDDA